MKKKNILIIGARAVGKTTLLSLFYEEVSNLLKKEGCKLETNLKTKNQLAESLNQLNVMLDSKYVISNKIDSTSEIKEYEFVVTHTVSKKKLIKYVFVDHPGGHFIKDIRKSELSSLFKKSDLIIYAIDTPYFVEENGRYNNQRNFPENFEILLKDNEEILNQKTIIFALLKCEKYNSIQVEFSFKFSFSNILDYLTENNQKKYNVLPVETVGGIVFEKFALNLKSDIPETVFMRKTPTSTISKKNIDVLSRIVMCDILEDVSTEKIFMFKTRKAKVAYKIINEFERMI